MEKYLHLVTVAIDSEGMSGKYLTALRLKCNPGKSSFQGLFSPNTSPYPFYLCKNQDSLHLKVNTQNGGEGLSGEEQGEKLD